MLERFIYQCYHSCEKAARAQRKTGLQKAGKLLLRSTLRHYKKFWLLGGFDLRLLHSTVAG